MDQIFLRCINCGRRTNLSLRDYKYFQDRGLAIACGNCRGMLVVEQTTKANHNHKVVNGAVKIAEDVLKGVVNIVLPTPKSQPDICECPECGKWHRRGTYKYR